MTLSDPRERTSVLRGLASDDEEVRRLAVERVVALAPDEVVPRLVDRLGDASWRVRKAAVERLCSWHDMDAVGGALIAALADDENPGRRNAAVDALIQCGATIVPRLVEAASTSDVDVRKFVVDVLAGIGHASATPALIARLTDEDANVRAAAADALGATGGEDAVRALVATATSDAQDTLVRFSALHALAALGQTVTLRELGSALADPVLRPAALDVIGPIDAEPECVDALLKSLDDRTRSTREAAMRSLLRGLSRLDGAAGDALVARIREVASRSGDLVASAIERLSGADLPTRLMLVQFLGLLRASETAIPLLLAGSDEALQPVVLAALESMGAVAESAIEEVWGGLSTDARRDACVFFGLTDGPRSADRLVSALDDADPDVRAEAARSLGARGVTDAVAPLVQRLKRASTDEFEGDRERSAVTEALIALAETRGVGGAERVIGLLAQALDGAGEPVRVAIARVLGRIGRSEDGDLVSLLLKDASSQVRRAAVDAIVRLGPSASAEPLHLAIADESADVRIAAAAALGEQARPEVFPDLCRLATDSDPRVRSTAVRAVGLRAVSGSPPEQREQAERVLDAACADEAPVALAAVEAAHATGESLERMTSLLRHREPDVVREAVRCLGVHGASHQLDAVIPLCAHSDWSVRAEAIHLLGERGVARAVPAILRRLEVEQDEFVRSVTLRALERLEE